jgi:hypothetical protein
MLLAVAGAVCARTAELGHTVAKTPNASVTNLSPILIFIAYPSLLAFFQTFRVATLRASMRAPFSTLGEVFAAHPVRTGFHQQLPHPVHGRTRGYNCRLPNEELRTSRFIADKADEFLATATSSGRLMAPAPIGVFPALSHAGIWLIGNSIFKPRLTNKILLPHS